MLSDNSRLDRKLNQEILMQVASGDLGDLTIPEVKELRRQGRIDLQTAVDTLTALGSGGSSNPTNKFWKNTEVVQIMNPAGMDNLLLNPSVNMGGDAGQFGENAKSYSCKKLFQDDIKAWTAQYNATNGEMPPVEKLRDYAQKREAYWQNIGFNTAEDKSAVKEFYGKILSYVKEGKPAPDNLLQAFGTFFNNPDMTNDEFLDFGERIGKFREGMADYTPPESEPEPEQNIGEGQETTVKEKPVEDPLKDVWKTRLREVWQKKADGNHPWNNSVGKLVDGPTPQQMAANPFYQGVERVQDQVNKDFTRTISSIAESYALSPIGEAARNLSKALNK